MPIKNNYWNRIYNWVTEASNYSIISSEKVDEDTDDICENGLSKALTQSSCGGKPDASMNFNRRKITRLSSPSLENDIATVNFQHKSNFYEDSSNTPNTIEIRNIYPRTVNPMPNNTDSDTELNGMRIFVKIKNDAVSGPVRLKTYDHEGTLFSDIGVYGFNASDQVFVGAFLKADSIHELIFYRGDLGLSVGVQSAFYAKYVPNGFAMADLSNVTSNASSVLKFYVTGWKTYVYKPLSPLPPPNDRDNFLSYFGLKYSNNTITIAISHSDYYGRPPAPRTFNFTSILSAAFEFANTDYNVICCRDYNVMRQDMIQGLSWDKYSDRIVVHFWDDGNENTARTTGLNLILTGMAKVL